jgi:chloride channel protein, CIC family
VLVGVACGGLAWVMTRCVYGAEDLFGRLPLHWSWWPAIGGVFVGVGGLIDPRVLGVGYATIGAELAGELALGALAVLLVVKLAVWSIALGSNTSGGILAPLLMLGAALGGLLGAVLPGAGEGTWALIGMAAAMAGVMRSPFTSIVFALELTHDVNALLALLVACTIAHLVSVLTLKRSILTEKITRRGYHVTREYEIDPLHALLVRDVMAAEVLTVQPQTPTVELYERLPEGSTERRQRLYPVLDSDERLAGVVAFSDVIAAYQSTSPIKAGELARQPMIAFADETLREVADRMVWSGHGVLPVTDREDPQRLVGLISQFDLLKAHERVLIEERHRERPLGSRRLAAGLGTLPWIREPAG